MKNIRYTFIYDCLIGKQILHKIFKKLLVFMVQCKRQLTALNNEKNEREAQSLL